MHSELANQQSTAPLKEAWLQSFQNCLGGWGENFCGFQKMTFSLHVADWGFLFSSQYCFFHLNISSQYDSVIFFSSQYVPMLRKKDGINYLVYFIKTTTTTSTLKKSYEIIIVKYFCVRHKNRRKHNQHFKLLIFRMN